MSKLRVVFAEMEGSDEALRAVVAQFTERLESPAHSVAVSLPAVEAQRLLPMSVKHRKYQNRGGPTKASKPSMAPNVALRPAPGREGPMASEVRELLKHRPMTSGEVI